MNIFDAAIEMVLNPIGDNNILIAQELFYQCISVMIVCSAISSIIGLSNPNWFVKVVVIGLYGLFISKFNGVINMLFKAFSYIGFFIGGSELESTLLLTPSQIMDQGWDAVKSIWNLTDFLDWFRGVDHLFRAICSLFIIFMFIFITVACNYYVIQFFVIAKLVVIQLPLSLIGILKFSLDTVIQTLIRQSVLIMVFSFFLSLSLSLIETQIMPEMTNNPSLKESISCIFGLVVIFIFVLVMPTLAASIASGQSSSVNFSQKIYTGLTQSTRQIASIASKAAKSL